MVEKKKKKKAAAFARDQAALPPLAGKKKVDTDLLRPNAAPVEMDETEAAMAKILEESGALIGDVKESLTQRQKRLRDQRDILLLKKQEERRAELEEYKKGGGIGADAALNAEERAKQNAKRINLAGKINAAIGGSY
jgi:hypothetical protein